MTAKTILALVQGACQECNIAGLKTVPTTVVSQTGELGKFVDWAVQSYNEVQNKHPNWRWLRGTFNLDTTDSDGVYTFGDCTDSVTASAITRFRRWLMDDPYDPPKRYLTSGGVGGEVLLQWMEWDYFKIQYRLGTQNDRVPIDISVDPINQLVLGPVPDGIYTITGDYQKANQILDITDDTDTPEMPDDYHDLIMWKVVQKYGLEESNQMAINKWNAYGVDMENDLEINQLPTITVDEPMA